MLGSEHNDEFFMDNGAVRTRTNRSGGIQGGISNGENIVVSAGAGWQQVVSLSLTYHQHACMHCGTQPEVSASAHVGW